MHFPFLYQSSIVLVLYVAAALAAPAAKLRTLTIPLYRKHFDLNTSHIIKRQETAPLYNDRQTQYTVKIDIGTPAQQFDVILDTGRYVSYQLLALDVYVC